MIRNQVQMIQMMCVWTFQHVYMEQTQSNVRGQAQSLSELLYEVCLMGENTLSVSCKHPHVHAREVDQNQTWP